MNSVQGIYMDTLSTETPQLCSSPETSSLITFSPDLSTNSLDHLQDPLAHQLCALICLRTWLFVNCLPSNGITPYEFSYSTHRSSLLITATTSFPPPSHLSFLPVTILIASPYSIFSRVLDSLPPFCLRKACAAATSSLWADFGLPSKPLPLVSPVYMLISCLYTCTGFLSQMLLFLISTS